MNPENNHKRIGPFRSTLTPYQDLIFKAYFDDRKTGTEIRELLKQQGITVAVSTVLDFIRVRRNRPNPHARTVNLDTYTTNKPFNHRGSASKSPKTKDEPEALTKHDLGKIKEIADIPLEKLYQLKKNP